MDKNGGKLGMQYEKKRFTVYSDNADVDTMKLNVMSDEDRQSLDSQGVPADSGTRNKAKHTVIPFGDRILVRRRRIGEKLGSGLIIASENTAERPTDLADVVYVPDLTFADEQIIENANKIVEAQSKAAQEGNADAFKALLLLNEFLKLKTIKAGDAVMISKYVGTDFHDNENTGQTLTLVNNADIIGLVVNQEAQ